MDLPSGFQVKTEAEERRQEGEAEMDLSDPAGDLALRQQVVKLIPEFNVRDIDKYREIMAAVQARAPGEVNIQSEHFMKICPKSEEQEKAVRETLAGMKVDYDRTDVQVGRFIINGLLPNTPTAAVATELQALGVTTKYVKQLRNGDSLLPLFVFKAPASQSQALHQLKRLGDRDVQIQSYTEESVPSSSSKTENAAGHNSPENRQCQMNSKKHHCQMYSQWNCRSAHAPPHHAGQHCGLGPQWCSYGNAMQGRMFGRQAANCCPLDSHCNGYGQRCSRRYPNHAPMQTCRPGPSRSSPDPSLTDLEMLSVLRELKDQVKKLKELPQQMQSIFRGNPPTEIPGGDQTVVGQAEE